MAGDADARLVARCLEGDLTAFDRLIERYQTPLYNGCLRLVGSAEDAQDTLQTVFLKAYEWIHSKCPKYLGSRPIYAERCLIDAGYQIKSKERIRIFRLPAEIVVAIKAMPGNAT